MVADFLKRSYFAVDGLWFVKAEERFGFDEAIALDEAVWEVMSKIQARKARAALGIIGNSLEDLAQAFSLKLTAEGYDYDFDIDTSAATFTIRTCPWYEILKSSGRTHIAETIAERICKREFAGWIREFEQDVGVHFDGRLCVPSEECDTCRVVFSRSS